MTAPRHPPDFGTLVRDFFCDRLVNQQNVSPHTVAAYRDTFRLLLAFVRRHHRTTPDAMTLTHLDAPTVLAFLDDLEAGRGNAVRTRNARLTATGEGGESPRVAQRVVDRRSRGPPHRAALPHHISS